MVHLASVSLTRDSRWTECSIDTNVEQLSVSKYFSGVSRRAPSGTRREDTACITPFDAYMSGSVRSAPDTVILESSVGNISRSEPSSVVTVLG